MPNIYVIYKQYSACSISKNYIAMQVVAENHLS